MNTNAVGPTRFRRICRDCSLLAERALGRETHQKGPLSFVFIRVHSWLTELSPIPPLASFSASGTLFMPSRISEMAGMGNRERFDVSYHRRGRVHRQPLGGPTADPRIPRRRSR